MGPWIRIVPLVAFSGLHPTTGSIHDPLLVLDGLEDSGIRLKCLSERLLSEVEVLWVDGKGRNITGNPLGTDTSGNAGSSIVLKPGFGNAVSCRIVDNLGKTSTESSVVIAESFFPTISPWLPAFVMILLFGIFLVLAAVYKIRTNQKATDQENIEEFKMELEEVQEKFQKENQEMTTKIEQIQAQLDFRRAQRNVVPLTLDELCKHPELSLRDRSRIVSCSEQLHPKPVVLAQESFSQGKHYWEVEVGDGSGWELGVLAEEIRDSLRSDGMVLPREREQVLGLGYSRGEFSIPGGRNSGPCPVLGVFLDQESRSLSFFDVEGKSLLASLPLRFSGNLFPFFSPGSDGKGLGIRSVGG
ncbi:butyrophilin subfamily 2 member A1-like isoform X2 [Neopelma chrysocephalum]|uniref:butyrophilin subfamily 2 member A1-like isoform X2 n=1 Tax=Neopelma chrysocephalum TaxID=114329 RepID=UPI000FCCF4B4|nr:butyrophilin subfamily 2 member A1-like isoform X2 [Neopelma chrysocephalum]XP_027529617.1 butyrophilin subfamily 2 member A1-like isoform X2 [Neopelma chrysocephalum]